VENALLALGAAVFLTATGVLLLVVSDWRYSIGLLAAQYIGVFVLTGVEWPLVMAITRLVAGWMAGAVLGMAMLSLPLDFQAEADVEARTSPQATLKKRRYRLSPGEAPSPVFHLLSAFLVCLAVLSQTPRILEWLPGLTTAQAWGGLILVGLGLLKLGFHAQPLHVTLGLLTLFSGFEILYAAINAEVLIAALSAAITLGVALAGAYLLLAAHMEPDE
jgi:hypothetical protein